MSSNVWFEEVNTALIKELKSAVRVKDTSGDYTSLSDNAFVVRKPDEDFKIEVFPCVSIYNRSYSFSKKRYNPAPVKVGVDTEKKIAIMEDSCIPYDLLYQIDFWTRLQTDMDCMTRTWLCSHFRQFNLHAIDDGGTDRYLNCITQGSIIRSDLVESQERLFHSIINLKIWVELDSETRYNKPMVVIQDIDAKGK